MTFDNAHIVDGKRAIGRVPATLGGGKTPCGSGNGALGKAGRIVSDGVGKPFDVAFRNEPSVNAVVDQA